MGAITFPPLLPGWGAKFLCPFKRNSKPMKSMIEKTEKSWLDPASPLELLQPGNAVAWTHDTPQFTSLSFPRVGRDSYFSYFFPQTLARRIEVKYVELGLNHKGKNWAAFQPFPRAEWQYNSCLYSCLCHRPAVWPWGSHFIFFGPSFLLQLVSFVFRLIWGKTRRISMGQNVAHGLYLRCYYTVHPSLGLQVSPKQKLRKISAQIPSYGINVKQRSVSTHAVCFQYSSHV